jgi:hypothetical protein
MSDSDDTDILVDESKFKTMRSFPNWPFIKDLLKKMADGVMNSCEIIETLSEFKNISYKNRFGKKRTCKGSEFDVLMDEYDD